MSDDNLQILLSLGVYCRRGTLRKNDGDKTEDIFPTEIFYYGMDQTDFVQQNPPTESTRSNKTWKREVSLVNQNEDTQTQRIVETVPMIELTNRVDEIEENDCNAEESDSIHWVRRSTRQTKKVVHVAKKVSARELKKPQKTTGKSKTTVQVQLESWKAILDEAMIWAASICERRNISRKGLEHFLLCSIHALSKTLAKFAVRSREIHISMMRVGSELTKFLEIAFLSGMKSINSTFQHMVIATFNKFIKNPSMMHQTSSVWIQTKEFLKHMMSGIQRKTILYALMRSFIETQTYFMEKGTSSEHNHRHVSYVLSQLSEFNNFLSNRLIQLSDQKDFGIAY
ncbi:unnamed protein product [Caenorhabditis angaria]|uniref:Uncharacterized protein n=1 Tax=Caenorhabditis angaria TaxID=860376 RepID=A0A9P1MT38_9PELO|nr:unnamed protein product [Caenorhabditis angaria]